MGITCDQGHYYFVMRVPKRYKQIDRRSQVRRALMTDSERAARAKEPTIRAEFIVYWEALAAGDDPAAEAALEAAKQLSAARGFQYRSVKDLAANATLEEILERLDSLVRKDRTLAPAAEGAAILGGFEPPPASGIGASATVGQRS